MSSSPHVPKEEMTQEMDIRKAELTDIPSMQEVFRIARRYMREAGNPHQWADDYPSDAQLTQDILSGNSYVCLLGGHVVATFVLAGGNDPTYDEIRDGAWPHEGPYATIHRIASNGTARGVFAKALAFALQRFHTIRIDTHRDNIPMRHLVEQAGFQYCGIILCWNGDERLAYQYH